MSSVQNWLRLCFHGGVLAAVLYAVLWMRQLGLLAPWLVFMFTMWGMAALAAFLCVALVVDVWLIRTGALLQSRPAAKPGARWAFFLQLHELLYALAFFFAVGVSFIFWGLYFYDRELIFPRAFAFPATLNHLQHTMPMVALAVELVAFHRRPRSAFARVPPLPLLWELCLLVGGVVAYLGLTAFFYFKAGRWPYPFMAGFSFSTFLVFASGAIVVGTCVTLLMRSSRIATWRHSL